MSDRKEQFRDQMDASSIELIQHTEPDERFYERKETGTWYASVTTKLAVLPKDEFLEHWKDKSGASTVNVVLNEASKKGTNIHNVIDDLCREYLENGSATLDWFNEDGYKKWTSEEWSGILRFADFFNNHVDEVILSEQRMFSDTLNTAGTVDGVFKLKDGRIALVDYKYTSALSDKFSVQTYCYKKMVEETYGLNIDVRGILWLRSPKRGADKSGKKLQGAGWEYDEHNEHDRDELIYNCADTIFMDKYRKKEIIPEHRTYQRIIKLG